MNINVNGASNGIRLRNGAAGFFTQPVSLSTEDSPLTIDATSFLLVNPSVITNNNLDNPFENWVVDGALIGFPNLLWAVGTLAQRPSFPLPGMTYFATDATIGAPGPGPGAVLTWEPALGWRDYTGFVHV